MEPWHFSDLGLKEQRTKETLQMPFACMHCGNSEVKREMNVIQYILIKEEYNSDDKM